MATRPATCVLCVCLCAAAVGVLGKRRVMWRGDESLSLNRPRSSNSGAKYTDPIERSHGDHKKSTFHPVNISTTLIMFTYMEISPLNKIFHPGFGSTHWKYQHLVRITLVSSCPYYGKLETINYWWWWLAKCWHKCEFLQNQRASFETPSPFCGYLDHRKGRETNFLSDSSFNIQQKTLHLQTVLIRSTTEVETKTPLCLTHKFLPAHADYNTYRNAA